MAIIKLLFRDGQTNYFLRDLCKNQEKVAESSCYDQR